jgi:branched-chain amino acid transport system permease protein
MQKNKLYVFLAAAVGLLILPLILQTAGNAWVRIADMALLYVLLALGLNIVVGYAGLLDLGFVAFFAIGAYMFGLMASPHLTDSFPWFAQMFPNGLHTPLWIVIPLGRSWRGYWAYCSARPRSSCVATTWPSSRWALAKSSACS